MRIVNKKKIGRYSKSSRKESSIKLRKKLFKNYLKMMKLTI